MTDFPRGGGGPAQPLPRGANAVLMLVSVATLVGLVAFLAWLVRG